MTISCRHYLTAYVGDLPTLEHEFVGLEQRVAGLPPDVLVTVVVDVTAPER